MSRIVRLYKFILSLAVIASLNMSGPVVRANDIVPTDDITGGASVFVFRGSSKRPQEKAGAANAFRAGGGSVRASRARMNAQVASNRKRRAELARSRASAAARARARERNARLRQSNTLTARAETEMQTGNIDSAITNFRAALKLNPRNADATNGLSEALTAKGIEVAGETLNDQAIVYLDEAVKLDPKNEVAYVKLGEIHDAKNRNEQAIASYEKAVAIDPGLSSAFVPLGLLYMQAGDDVKAEGYLTKAEQAGLTPIELRMARAAILAKRNQPEEALAVFDRLIAAEPTNAAAYYQKAALCDRIGRDAQAFAGYQEAVKVDQTYSPAWFDLGVAYYNRGDYNNALNAYQQVVKYDPENGKAYANLASTYRQLERFAEANAQYKLASEKGVRNDRDLYSEWGFCLGKTNEWDKSVVRLTTARDLDPDALDHSNLGWAYYNGARTDKANNNEVAANQKLELGKAELEKAVAKDPKMDAAYVNLGATNNSLGNYEAAVAALNIALSLRNDWVIAINQLGFAYRGTNNLNAAIEQFRRVTVLDSNNLVGLVNLGEVYHLTGNKKEAKRVHDRLKKIDPALANRLNNFLSGKAVADEAKRKIESKIPTIKRIPY